MSQFDFGTIDPYVVDGVQLADMLNQWRDAVHSWHRGAARPAYVVPGQMWINDTGGATNWIVNVYVSAAVGDKPVFTYNTTTGDVILAPALLGPPQFNMRLYNEQVLAAPATQMNVTVPPGAKAIEIWFFTANAGNVNDATGLILYDLVSGAPNTGANHNYQNLYSSATTPGASAGSNQASWTLGGGQSAFWGVLRLQLATPIAPVLINGDYTAVTSGFVPIQIHLSMFGGVAGTVTGFRLLNGSGTNFAAGSYMRCLAAY